MLAQIEQLTRCYGTVRAVDAVSFTVQRGQILGFLGTNGAGKSTTLRMLAGVLAPDGGRILINGIDLLDQPLQAKRQLGYLPEQPPLYPELTVNEQLLYSANLHGLKGAASRKAVANMQQRCGLNEVGGRLIRHLSKGYQQRVAIAQAVLHEPPLLILDEPTSGLDPLQSQQIQQLILELGQECGVLMSSHRIGEIQSLCTHVQIMRAGRLIYAAALADLQDHTQSTRLRISLDNPPLLSRLLALPKVEHVEILAVGRFRIHHTPGANLSPSILEYASSENWGLWELTPEQITVEQVFIESIIEEEQR